MLCRQQGRRKRSSSCVSVTSGRVAELRSSHAAMQHWNLCLTSAFSKRKCRSASSSSSLQHKLLLIWSAIATLHDQQSLAGHQFPCNSPRRQNQFHNQHHAACLKRCRYHVTKTGTGRNCILAHTPACSTTRLHPIPGLCSKTSLVHRCM